MTTLTIHSFGAAIRRGLLVTTALAAALALQANDKDHDKSKEHTSGKGDTASCLKEAGYMNTATIKFAQLGAQKAQNAELRRFSEQLERDHKKSQEKLEAIAKKHNVMLPTSLEAECQEKMSKLQALSGSEFDKEFAKGFVQGHAMAISKLKDASTDVKDSDFAEYAKDMLAQVKRHQERGREVAKAVGLDQSTIASLETQTPEAAGTSGSSIQSERGSSTSDNSSADQKSSSDTQDDQSERKDLPRQP